MLLKRIGFTCHLREEIVALIYCGDAFNRGLNIHKARVSRLPKEPRKCSGHILYYAVLYRTGTCSTVLYYYCTVREGPVARTNLMARCEILIQ